MDTPPSDRSLLVIGTAACLAVLIFTAGCTVSFGDSEFTFSFGDNTHAEPPASTDTVRIGAFNIQVFGETKASNPDVMEVLARIIRTYDIVAVQEIRDGSGTALPALVDAVNADGSQYACLEGPRLGRTSSKEQYAYLYDTRTIAPSGGAFTYPEPAGSDPFHREPYIMLFRVTNGTFDAVLIVIHTDPDEATDEINALADVVAFARTAYPVEQDFIIMGDLNADGSYFDEDGASTLRNDDYTWLIGNDLDTTTKATEYTYDRIIITEGAIPDFTGDAGVFHFDSEYGLTENETWAVSDHYPVYATFRTDRDSD
jgi:deoxyribonuclease-1-like protein